MKSEHRLSPPRLPLILAIGLWIVWPAQSWSQSITAILSLGGGYPTPQAVAVNSATNKIYVSAWVHDGGYKFHGSLFVIDGATHGVTTVPMPDLPSPIASAVNESTNKIYVASAGGITVIDGATNATTLVSDPNASGSPSSLAVNPSTNKIYVANAGGNITVIDGATNSTTTITDPNAMQLTAIAVNPVTNKIYVANTNQAPGGIPGSGSIYVIDGATNSTTMATDPNAFAPVGIAVNTITNKIYVANAGNYPRGSQHGNVTVIDGVTNATTTITDPNALNPGFGIGSQGLGVAVNSTTNRIYVVNGGSHNVTVIDGATNSTTTVTDPNAASALPAAVAVDEVANTIYIANLGVAVCNPSGCGGGSVTVIDGSTGSTATLIDANEVNAWGAGVGGAGVSALAVDPVTNQIYALYGGLAIIDGGVAATTHALAVLLPGTGTGTVTSNPVGIDCEASTCAASFDLGTNVKLAASAAAGSYFAGWSGPCTGTNPCDLMANSDQVVTATFSPAVAVPSVAGLMQDKAARAIIGAGLVVGTVTQQPNNSVAPGSVISQSPMAGADVAPGSAVNLVVSADPSSGGGGSLDLLILGSLLGCLLLGFRRGLVLQ